MRITLGPGLPVGGRTRLRWPAMALLVWAGSGSACASGGGVGRSERPLKVVATTTPLADFARAVGGSRAAVYDVVKSNVDAHDFEPAPADLEALRHADVVIENGLGLEAWFRRTIRSAEPRGAIVDASKGVHVLPGPGGDRAEPDPHIWLDPRNAKVMVANITAAFIAADPRGAGVYRARQRAYAAQLDALDAEIASAVRSLTDKKLVTNHDAFGYYAARYGLELVGSVIPSFDSQAELSGADLARLVDRIESERVKAVFAEAALPAKTAKTIASEAGVKVVAGDDALFGDSLGPRGSDGDTYLKMQRHNTRVIVANLR